MTTEPLAPPRLNPGRGRIRTNLRLTPPLRPAAPTRLERTLLRYGVRPLLVGCDVGSVAVAASLSGWLHETVVAFAVLLVVVSAPRQLYRGRLTLAVLDDAPSLLMSTAAASVLTLVLADVVLHRPATGPVLVLGALQAVLALLFRAVGYAFVRETRRRRVVEHPVLILGAGRVGGQLANVLLDHPEFGLQPVGFLDNNPLLEPSERPVPVLADYSALAQVIVEFRVRNVIVAFGGLPESSVVDVIHTCDRLDCEVFFVPRLFEIHSTTRDMEQVWGLPLVRLRRAAFRRPTWRLKRAFDVLLSGIALVGLSPVLAACALAVRLDTGRGILFRQVRVGLDGRRFTCLKFRTLRPADESESATNWSIAQDDRVTRVGRFLRRTSLDELPQLWNIFRGDMTIVGPRPERPHFVDTFSQSYTRYMARHRVPAGLTGWAQVHGLRGDTSIEDRARFDNYYIENWSMWGDVKIMLRTLWSVVGAHGR